MFRDLTPVLADPPAFSRCIDELARAIGAWAPDTVVGVEARGFWFGPPVAQALNVGFVPVRKPGKLPPEVMRLEYELEYGTDALELNPESVTGKRVAVVDDVLATGGTAAAVLELIGKASGSVVGAAFVLELAALGGRERLGPVPVQALGVLR